MRAFTALKYTKMCIFIFLMFNASAQKIGDKWVDQEGNEWELVVTPCQTEQKSDYQNRKPEFKPGWFFEAFKMIQSITNFFYGVKSFVNPETYTSDYNSGPFVPEEQLIHPPTRTNFFSFGLGAAVTQKGVKYHYTGGSSRTNIWYLQMPQVKVRYNIRMNDASTLFFDATPYYAVALTGNLKFGTTSNTLKFGKDTDANFKRSDWGLKAAAGYRWKNQPFFAGLMYDFGLRNISPLDGVKVRNRALGIQFGYKF